MPTKIGMGGEGQEQYNPNDGRYVDDGIPNKSTFTKKNNLGNELTPQQEEYFQNSKVRDENGNLMIMYHGTPNGTFDEFKPGSYFTNIKEYADNYQNPYASSISNKSRLANNSPKTYAVYLNITKPFDLNNEETKRIYINEYIKGGWAAGIDPYMPDSWYQENIKTIDWTEGNNLIEFLEENGYDYDGMVLDEGGVPKSDEYGRIIPGEYISRGKSFIPFNPNQIKLVSNQNPTNSNSISDGQTQTNNTKQQQLEIIQKHNPAPNDINTWIRDVNDIKTLEETLSDSDYVDYEEYNPDWTKSMAQEAINSGYVTVYSSYPIEQGIFVSPSRMEAQSYAGNGRVYSKKVPVNSIAWIDPTQGQYADIEEAEAMKYFNTGDE